MKEKQEPKKTIHIEPASLPKGGAAYQGLGEDVQVNLFTGNAAVTIPVYTSACRDYEPELKLEYRSTTGCGVFGLGFRLDIPFIERKTSARIPGYRDMEDVYISSEAGELMRPDSGQPQPDGRQVWSDSGQAPLDSRQVWSDSGQAQPDGRQVWSDSEQAPLDSRQVRPDSGQLQPDDGQVRPDSGQLQPDDQDSQDGYQVYRYIPVVDKPQDRIEFWKSGQDSFWKVMTGDNRVFVYGTDGNSRIAGPKGQVLSWLLKETIDCKGNRTRYVYRESGNYRCIQSIWYGNYPKEGKEDFCFEVRFSYEPGCGFTSCRGGFAVRTDVLCRRIEMVHHFTETEEIVRRMNLAYDQEDMPLLTEITQEAYAKSGDRPAECSKVPPLVLSYHKFAPLNGEFTKLEITGTEEPCGAYAPEYRFVDLYGEGIAGILYSNGTADFYYEPLGGGKYAEPALLPQFPIDRDLRGQKCTLASLEGNGIYDLVAEQEGRAGYYEFRQGEWSGFTPFLKYPDHCQEGHREFADLQGDRMRHMFYAGTRGLCYYPGNGKAGVEEPVFTQAPEEFPFQAAGARESVVAFLDILGDGLPHRVKVTNGTVEYWPNLGYGHFGEKCRIENAPYIEEGFDAGRIYFADVNGSGTQDMIYVYGDRLDIYVNQGGSRFREPFSVRLPESYTSRDRIQFADLNGCGYTSLIFTKMGEKVCNYQYDFNQGKKPYLLERIDNHMGYFVKISYSSSTAHYLEDKERGAGWENIPPFPVFVADRIEKTNEVTGLCVEQRLHYRNGYYDSRFKEFCGFSCIEEWKQETLQSYEGVKRHTRYCFHNGYGSVQGGRFPGLSDQARLAMKGKLVRKEIYEQNGQEEEIPVSAEEIIYEVSESAVPKDGDGCGPQDGPSYAAQNRGSYLVQERERILRIYDGCTDDPRIEHTFMLDIDEYGNVENKLRVYYPRKGEGIEEQKKACAYLEERKYINDTGLGTKGKEAGNAADGAGIRRQSGGRMIGADYITRNYTIGGIRIGPEGLAFTSAYEQAQGALRDLVEYGGEFEEGRLQARMEQCSRVVYWDDAQSAELPAGRAGHRQLVHHTEKAVMPVGTLEDSFFEDGGYIQRDGYWWDYGLVSGYDGTKYYLPCFEENSFVEKENPLYRKSSCEYDDFALMPVAVTQWESEESKLVTRYGIDYGVLQYDWMQDANDNISEVVYDPLGMVAAASRYGYTDGQFEGSRPLAEYIRKAGSFGQVLEDQGAYLQQALKYYGYDLFAYEERRQPVSVIELSSESMERAEGMGIRCRIRYYDGFGNLIQQKRPDGDTYCVDRQCFHNEDGKEILEYPPYFSDSPYFEPPAARQPYKITYYDASQREIKTIKAFESLASGGTGTVFSKNEYTPWEVRKYDEDDTVLDSEYYASVMRQGAAEESDRIEALEKAAVFYNTPDIEHLNCRGYKCRDYLDAGRESSVDYSYDSAGQVAAVRNYEKGEEGHIVILTSRTMTGDVFCYDTSDSGKTVTLPDIYRQPVHTWDGRGNHIRYEYDRLGRQVQVRAEGAGVIRKDVYGAALEGNKEKNCVGRLIRQYDQAGQVDYKLYTVFGKPYEKCRTYSKGYEKEIDWTDDSLVPMEAEQYTERFTYNLLEEVLAQTTPGNERLDFRYNGFGLPEKAWLSCAGKAGTGSIAGTVSFEYAPNGLFGRKVYGNGFCTQYRYQPDSMLLEEIRTTDAGGKLIQDLLYYYDPAGNITRIRNMAADTVIYNWQATQGGAEYTYDERYQLIRAVGRELPGSADPADYEKLETYLESYSYDPAGNMTEMAHRAPSTNWKRSMEYEAHANRMAKADGNAFAYDHAGNLIHTPAAELIWDRENRLSGAVAVRREGEEPDREYYVYDSGGMRVRKVTKRKTAAGMEVTDKRYVGIYERKVISLEEGEAFLDGSVIHFGNREKPVLTYYSWRKDDRGRETDDPGSVRIHYLTDDHLNSVSIESGEDGAILTVEEYYPFGSTAVSFGNAYAARRKEYRYCNKENDVVTGFYYYGSRYYYAVYGRMVSPDRMDYVKPEDNKTLHRYRYCENNPIKFVDLDGFCVVVLYHGTTSESANNIKRNRINLTAGRTTLDFGRGFYVTRDRQQAEDWARRRGQGAVLTFQIPKAEYDELNGRVLGDSQQDIRDWEELVYKSRSNRWGDLGGRYDQYDYIEGTMLYSVREFMRNERYTYGGHQIAFRTQNGIDLLNRYLPAATVSYTDRRSLGRAA